MITGTHVLFYSTDAETDRAFFRDVLGLPALDVGGGWLIFALPPAEAGIHPVEKGESRPPMHGGRSLLGAVVYLMCDDLAAEMERLRAKKVECSAVETAEWGTKTTLRLPSGGEIGLYQPRHPTALDLKR
ncbi:MAG TPA: VOC family protein [Terriglobales bacterium]|nr:VOC family protein [Terriglobales bacterium]